MRIDSKMKFVAVLCLGLCAPVICHAAAYSPQTVQSGSANTQPQPSLTVDRDPFPSPDPPSTSTQRGHAGLPGKLIFTQDVDEVVLSASVFDNSGRLIEGLTQSDFQVFEDNVEQKILSFRREDVPVSLGILVDNSGSMYDKRKAVNKAALDLVRSSNPDDEVFIVNFSDSAYLDADFTSDINKLNDGLGHIESRGGTALYDAVVAAADHEAESAKHRKQVLLVITDGADNSSTSTLESAIRRVQDLSGPTVYAIGLLFGDEDSQRSKRESKRALISLTDQTGGLSMFPKSLNDVDAVAAQIAEDIRSQYTIGYKSTKPSSLGGYRVVHVTAKAKGFGKLTVRTRAGYYPKTVNAPDVSSSPAQADQQAPTLPAAKH